MRLILLSPLPLSMLLRNDMIALLLWPCHFDFFIQLSQSHLSGVRCNAMVTVSI